MLSGPVRAALASGTRPTGLRLTAAVLAVTSLAGLAGFALSFLSAYFTDAPTHATPHFPEGTAEHAAVEVPASLGLASYVVTSLVLAVPVVWLVLRWRLPFGTVTAYATGLALLATVLLDFQRPYQIAATALGGLAVDAFLRIAARRAVRPRIQAVVTGGLLPAVTWTAQLAAMGGVHWPPALVSGVVTLSVLLSALAGGFLAAERPDAPVTF